MDIKRVPRPLYVKYRMQIITVVTLLAIVVYTVVTALSPRRKSIDSERLKIAVAKEGPFTEFVDVEGVVNPIMTIHLNATEGGFVERIVSEEGAMLSQGDTILVLNNSELLRTIDDERELWEKNMRNLREQEIQMMQKSIDLQLQTAEQRYQIEALDRKLMQTHEEYSMGIKSRAELDIVEAENSHLRNKLKLQMQSLKHDSAATQLRKEMIAAERRAAERKLFSVQKRLGGLVLRAPSAGQMGNINLTIGQQVGAGTKIGELKIMNRYKVCTHLNEYYVERIYAGLPAMIVQKEDTFMLRISRVVPEVKDRQFEVELLFKDSLPRNIRPGKNYRVRIELARPEQAVVIPRGDFYKATNGEWIFRIDEGTNVARRVEVELGRQNPEQFEVVKGIKSGDRVVVGGYGRIGDAEELLIEN